MKYKKWLQKKVAILLAVTMAVCGAVSVASAQTKVRFTLDWSPGSYHAPFLIALYQGYYAEEGLDVTIFKGKGSGEVVRQLASGVYDIGHPDINVLIEFDARNPDSSMPMLMMNYEQYPSGIFTLKSSGISEPKQLEGRKLGPSINDSTFKLWPVFAELTGIDTSKVNITYLDPALREALLVKGEVDAITGQIFRSVLDLNSRGVPNDQIVKFMYKDYGLDLYGNGIVASKAFTKEHPDAVKGFIRATIKGMKAAVKDPDMAIDMLLKYEPLLKGDVERKRLDLAFDCCMLTENVLKDGYGGVDLERLKRSISQISKIYDLPRQPGVEEIFDASFLPPKEERMVK